jgi:hypothetical protein
VAVKNSSSGRSGRHSSEAPDYETLKKWLTETMEPFLDGDKIGEIYERVSFA